MIEKYNYNAVNCWQISSTHFAKVGNFHLQKTPNRKKNMSSNLYIIRFYMVRYSLILMTFL